MIPDACMQTQSLGMWLHNGKASVREGWVRAQAREEISEPVKFRDRDIPRDHDRFRMRQRFSIGQREGCEIQVKVEDKEQVIYRQTTGFGDRRPINSSLKSRTASSRSTPHAKHLPRIARVGVARRRAWMAMGRVPTRPHFAPACATHHARQEAGYQFSCHAHIVQCTVNCEYENQHRVRPHTCPLSSPIHYWSSTHPPGFEFESRRVAHAAMSKISKLSFKTNRQLAGPVVPNKQ
ncbi:hypothetical protein B0H10DRAFT_2200429 [Mycena sp. CBHHK59/15]|nr:hypothetical protein B0H10DRAFT_2200429 [Mycena sp. CBHHK59/15]